MSKEIKKNPNEVNYCYYDIAKIRFIDNFKLTGKHKGVLWVLDSCGESIYPSRKTIADSSGFSRSTVDSAIKDLKRLGCLSVIQRQGTSSIYVIDRKMIRRIANEQRAEANAEKERVEQEVARLKSKCDIGGSQDNEGWHSGN
jgi:DNA-binding MarR family transcriptional regulator